MYSRTLPLILPQSTPTAAAALYTAPANTRTRITKMTATNTGAAARLVTVYLVQSGGTADTGNTLVSAYSVGPGQDVTLATMIGQVLEAGGSIQAIVDAGTDLTISAAGVEVTI